MRTSQTLASFVQPSLVSNTTPHNPLLLLNLLQSLLHDRLPILAQLNIVRTLERVRNHLGMTAKRQEFARLQALDLDARIRERLSCGTGRGELGSGKERRDEPWPTTSALSAIVSPARAARTNLVGID